MKFIVSKKIIDNRSLHTSIVWMVVFLLVSMLLSSLAKGIDFGITPSMWVTSISGNDAEFIEPLTINDLLLTLHTDLFGLILVFILISALYIRTSRSRVLKTSFLVMSVSSLLLYPLGLLASLWMGHFAILASWLAFFFFHFLMLISAADILILLLRKRF